MAEVSCDSNDINIYNFEVKKNNIKIPHHPCKTN